MSIFKSKNKVKKERREKKKKVEGKNKGLVRGRKDWTEKGEGRKKQSILTYFVVFG